MERDRLNEYVQVVSSRASKAEAAAQAAQAALREERRRTAKLEQAMEKARWALFT